MKEITAKSPIKSFMDLKAWQEGHKLVLDIYRITEFFPKNEQYGLVSQMRRAAVSITSNVAEGFSRDSFSDKSHFYIMAHGSLTELQNQILVAKDVKYIGKSESDILFVQTELVYRILGGLIRSSKEKR